jgi:hypothetical protein
MVFTLIAGSVAALIRGVESRSDETYQSHLMVFANAVDKRKVWSWITAIKAKSFVAGYVVIATELLESLGTILRVSYELQITSMNPLVLAPIKPRRLPNDLAPT